MILAIDIGNTHISFGGVCEDGSVTEMLQIATDHTETRYGYAVKLKQVLELAGIDPAGFTGAALSSVVPPVTESLKLAVERTLGKKPMIVGPGIKTGMNVRIDDPSTVAADLIVSSVAAMTYYGSPVIVVDMGTATTMVVIDKDGCYKGGAIVPGLKLSYASLASGTSLLPDISIIPPKKVVATNTVDCMRSGAVYGTAALLDGMIDRMEQELGYECRVVATGGLAQSIVGHCRRDIIYDGDLILKGLWTLYQKNTRKK